ncbi:MAG: hypothetical protein HYT37_00510 [Candidatus Sungbacteria bacterium]|nr:hypothetical protein [Candidatus Sungbacteria bacterium]
MTKPQTSNYESGSVVNNESQINKFEVEKFEISKVPKDEKDKILSEFPVYGSRKIEQTYLTLPEWYQVYSYNEFGDFLHSGGRQSDFPFLRSIKNFWGYYRIALSESRDEKFNWQYNFVTLVIGANLSAEYFIKSVYENTVGTITQFISGSNTEADRFIANSWNNYAKKMYQATWYHYPYFDDLKGIWSETPLFNKNFIRNFERKIAFSISYLIKGTYAKIWLLTAAQKENQTFSIVYAKDKLALENEGIKILKEISGDKYLIETERYAGFEEVLLKLISKDVKFAEIQGHDIIAFSYLSNKELELFSNSDGADILDKRKLFFEPNGYTHRVTLRVKAQNLKEVIDAINSNGNKFEMIYDF